MNVLFHYFLQVSVFGLEVQRVSTVALSDVSVQELRRPGPLGPLALCNNTVTSFLFILTLTCSF